MGGRRAVIERKAIEHIASEIGRKFNPDKVVLFGSYAYGSPTEDSDIDMLVILPFKGRSSKKAIEILEEVNPDVPLELIVRTPDEVRKRLGWNDFFLREIMDKGKTLYESARK
jgi:predicted nucleotidyltransferase